MTQVAPTTNTAPRLLTTAQVAEMLNVPHTTLRAWRHKGEGPKSFALGKRAVRYVESDVTGWIDEQIRKASA